MIATTDDRVHKAPSLGWRWLLVIARAAGCLLAFVLVIIPHFVATLLGRRDFVPPPFLGSLAWISGVRITVQGQPEPNALLLGNHVGWIDILALAGVSRTAFVAHSGISAHPVLNWLCLQNATLFISRDDRSTVHQQVDQVLERLGERRLTIFPEATTSDGTSLLPFRSSLLSAVERLPHDITVQPMALKYEDVPEVSWYGDEPGIYNVQRIFARIKPVKLTIIFLEPLAGDELANRKSMAAATQAKVEKALLG